MKYAVVYDIVVFYWQCTKFVSPLFTIAQKPNSKNPQRQLLHSCPNKEKLKQRPLSSYLSYSHGEVLLRTDHNYYLGE